MKRTIQFTLTAFMLLAVSTPIVMAQNNEDVRITPQLIAALKKYDIEGYKFSDGLIVITSKDGKYKHGFMNVRGEVVIPCKYDYVHDFHEGLAFVKKNGKCGFINKHGEMVIQTKYDYDHIGGFQEGLAVVSIGEYENEKYGFINTKGEQVAPCKYDYAHEFHEGLACVKKNEKWGFINARGDVVIPLIYDECGRIFHEGLACVKKNEKWGFINTHGDAVIPLIYDEGGDFHEGLACVHKDNQAYYINSRGEKVLSISQEYYRYGCGDFHEGLANVACIDNNDNIKYGFINPKGELVIPCKYENPGAYEAYFSCGLAPVCYNDKYGFINTKGKVVVPFKYDMAWRFYDGMALVCRNDKWGFINTEGKEIVPCNYSVDDSDDYAIIDSFFFSDGLAKIYHDSESFKVGFVDKYGNTTFSNSSSKKTGSTKKQRKTSRRR